MAEEPGELDGEGGSEVGVDGSGTVCDRHGLPDEASASRYLPMEGCGRSKEAVRELVRVGPGDEGTNRGVARADGPCRSDDRRALGGYSGPLDSRADDGLMEGLNSLFSAVKRKARGYRSVEYMTTMLYFVAGKLTLPCH